MNEEGRGEERKERKERDIGWIGKVGEENEREGKGFRPSNTLPFHPSNWITYLSRIVASRCSADKGNTSSSDISERRPTRPTLIERDGRGYRAPSSSTDPVLPFPASNGARFSTCVWKLLVNVLLTMVRRFPPSPKKIFTDILYPTFLDRDEFLSRILSRYRRFSNANSKGIVFHRSSEWNLWNERRKREEGFVFVT